MWAMVKTTHQGIMPARVKTLCVHAYIYKPTVVALEDGLYVIPTECPYKQF